MTPAATPTPTATNYDAPVERATAEPTQDASAALRVRPVNAGVVHPVRAAVLRPGMPFESSVWSGDDETDTVHLAAFAGDEVVGCATLLRRQHPERPAAAARQLRGMAVLPGRQGAGVGSALLREALTVSAATGDELIWCNAREMAVAFYRRHGFNCDSDVFYLPPLDIAHRVMSRPVKTAA